MFYPNTIIWSPVTSGAVQFLNSAHVNISISVKLHRQNGSCFDGISECWVLINMVMNLIVKHVMIFIMYVTA